MNNIFEFLNSNVYVVSEGSIKDLFKEQLFNHEIEISTNSIEIFNNFSDLEKRQCQFIISLFSMAAQMAMADGNISMEEVETFKRFIETDLSYSIEQQEVIFSIWRQALVTPREFVDFIQDFNQMSTKSEALKVVLVEFLFIIAAADGIFHENEEKMIESAINHFNLEPTIKVQWISTYLNKNESKKSLLGIIDEKDKDEINSKYQKWSDYYNAETLFADGLPKEFGSYIENKLAKINVAYKEYQYL